MMFICVTADNMVISIINLGAQKFMIHWKAIISNFIELLRIISRT